MNNVIYNFKDFIRPKKLPLFRNQSFFGLRLRIDLSHAFTALITQQHNLTWDSPSPYYVHPGHILGTLQTFFETYTSIAQYKMIVHFIRLCNINGCTAKWRILTQIVYIAFGLRGWFEY